ncbi:hypothetical protein EV363DRAFT_768795 [Boletus edulis]|nr:hypothetical protein EV363DRAFT_768795 [Boletus edulis]
MWWGPGALLWLYWTERNLLLKYISQLMGLRRIHAQSLSLRSSEILLALYMHVANPNPFFLVTANNINFVHSSIICERLNNHEIS